MLQPEGEGGDGRGNPDGHRSGIPPSLHQERGGDAVDGARRDVDGPIWRDGAFHADTWQKVPDDGELPEVPVVVSKKRWLAERSVLAARNTPLGLRLEPGEDLEDLASDIGKFALVALSFPKFSDGRAFSTARLLREKYGFTGELRAIGNVLSDQITFMRRVGFDSYEVVHAPTRKALAHGRIAEVTLVYQPGERGKRAL